MMRSAVWPAIAVLGACAGPVRKPPPPPPSAAGGASNGAPEGRPAPATPSPGWHALPPSPLSGAGAALLLTDGTVMVQELETEHWWRLAPDPSGSYALGTWSRLADAPSGYSPLYFASAVLPDGDVIIEGGEYIAGDEAFSKRGAIYDPVADRWQEVAPPAGWTEIGDASGMVLPDGTFLLSDCCTKLNALFDERTAVWRTTGLGKADINDEESWALLPDGGILTIDTNNFGDVKLAERYDPATGMWSSAGDTPVQISDTTMTPGSSHEIGPEVVRPDGSVLAIGGNGHNVLYDSTSHTWTTLPDLPMLAGQQLDVADGPAAMLPNGDVLIAASPGIYNAPTEFFTFDGQGFTQIAAPAGASAATSYQYSMLVLPTGEVLLTDFSPIVQIYTPDPGVTAESVPVVTAAPVLIEGTSARTAPGAAPRRPDDSAHLVVADRPVATLLLARSYELEGTRLAGISQGAYYGDDLQPHTNYPLVRLTNVDTGHVTYCRTYAHSTRSIARDAHGTTRFDVPTTAELGEAMLEVVANGIASPGILVNVK